MALKKISTISGLVRCSVGSVFLPQALGVYIAVVCRPAVDTLSAAPSGHQLTMEADTHKFHMTCSDPKSPL